ncbi:MAG TPA: peptidoglycan glycosyltransferase, partial [Blautia sp.]|nr:peptidoglycan glycosyltransferase [Blautia sp.]
MSMIGYLIYFDGIKSDDFINSPYNTRQDSFSDRVVRGKIMSADGQVLAQT